MEKDLIVGGKADDMTVEDIAKKHKVSVENIERQIEKGISVESEHVDGNEEMAKEIAMDHLVELPDYYDRLDKMEEEGKKALKESAILNEDIIAISVALAPYILSIPLLILAKKIINDNRKNEFINTLTSNKDSSVNIKTMMVFIKKYGDDSDKTKAEILYRKIKDRVYTNKVLFSKDINDLAGFKPEDEDGIKISYTNIKLIYKIYKKVQRNRARVMTQTVNADVEHKNIITVRLLESDIKEDDLEDYRAEILERAAPGELHKEYLAEVSFLTQKEREKMANKYSVQKTIEKESEKFSLGRLAYIFAGFTGLVLKSIIFKGELDPEDGDKLNFIDRKKYKEVKRIVNDTPEAIDIADEIERELNEEDPDKEKLKELKKNFVKIIRDEIKKKEEEKNKKVEVEEKELDKKLTEK